MISLPDRKNIRYDLALEPMGAVGDLGWYNMRAVVEFLSPDAAPAAVQAVVRRDPRTGAAIAGAGLLAFTDGATANWACSFDAGADVIELRIVGTDGALHVENFLGQDPDGSAGFRYRCGGGSGALEKTIRVPSERTGPALMFDAFVAAASDASLRDRWIRHATRTQALLDAAWQRAGG